MPSDFPILHHYPNSPFAEKIRLVMGHQQRTWQSVIVPDVMPKPDVVALTGGYRKTPFLQMGADIYCDTVLIVDVLESLSGKAFEAPSLYATGGKGLNRIVASWADDKLFWSAMGYNFMGAANPAVAQELFKQPSPEAAMVVLKNFGEDRAKMRVNMTQMKPADALVAYKTNLRGLNAMLVDQPFVLGDALSWADICAYAPIWFTRHRVPNMAAILDLTPNIKPWMDRVAAIGHGASTLISSKDAIAIAKAATPVDAENEPCIDLEAHKVQRGDLVSVTPLSFGVESTEGVLIAATKSRYTLRRETADVGVVHVHFPRLGYALKKAEN